MGGDSFTAQATSGAGDSDGTRTGVAGSLAINVAVSDVQAYAVTGAFLSVSGDLNLSATSTTKSTAKALPDEDGVTAESVGVGASVAMNIVDNITRAEVRDAANIIGVADLNLATLSDSTLITEAEAGAEGGTAVAPVVAIAYANEDTVARLGTGASLTTTGGITLDASHKGSADTKAKGDAEATGGGSAAVGASVGFNVITDTTTAVVESVTTQIEVEPPSAPSLPGALWA